MVDTPGTGSVNVANTDEARRALSILGDAVLVVAADPPVAVAELDLVAEAMATASRVAVVVNKIDHCNCLHLSPLSPRSDRVLRNTRFDVRLLLGRAFREVRMAYAHAGLPSLEVPASSQT